MRFLKTVGANAPTAPTLTTALHVILKSSICTSASPQQERSYWGLRVTQNAYFSLMTQTKQLLLVTFCYTIAGIGILMCDVTGWTDERWKELKIKIFM